MKYLYTIDDSTHTKNDGSIAAELDKYITTHGIKEIYRLAIASDLRS